MRALIQRVSEASVSVDSEIVAQVGRGLLIFLGVRADDTAAEAEHLAQKVIKLRILPDETQKMNLSVMNIGGELLIVSQFTLYADTSGGNRPSYSDAAKPEIARILYDAFVAACKRSGLAVSTGIFQAHMDIRLNNDGPVTLMCVSESKLRQS